MNINRKQIIENHLSIGLIKADLSTGKVYYKSGKEATAKDKAGYYNMSVRYKGKRYCYRVHEVIAVAYGLDVVNKVVNHIDGVKTNNLPSNLEAVTIRENVLHAVRLGLNKETGSGHITNNKLTIDEVKKIKHMIAANIPLKDIAKEFNIAACTVSNIKTGKRWKSI